MIKKFILIVLVFVANVVYAENPKIYDALKKLEDNMEMKSDIRAKVILTQQKVDQGVKVIEMIYYRRDSDDSFLIVMTAPETEKGNGYLRVGDNFWMYRRNTRTFQHINRDESIGGSDAKADDFEKRKLTELYEGAKDEKNNEKIKETMLGKVPVYELEAKARVNDVDYPRKIYWLKKDTFLTLKEESYSSSNTLMQTAFFLQYTTVDNRFVPIKHIYIDEFEKGNKTMVEISDISTKKIEDKIFTKAYLENLSK
ncbi:MAG: outer membrane lipoprotein-sorting protein [Candidatus Firestonebacteria bacterium]|nr:outer membrane lipoprotein-sorting protein [Candidatus Firestonebacteria bacterium]